MKKNSIVLITLLSFSIVMAQRSKREEGIIFGIKGGLNISNMMGDLNDNNLRTSIHLGVVSEIVISDRVSLQPELLYSGQGYSDGSIVGFSRKKYNYITLPILAKINVIDQVSVEAGPSLGFLIGAKHKTDTSNTSIDGASFLDFGLNLGATYELKNGIFFSSRYNYGLINANNSSTKDAVKITNTVIQCSVGVLF